jgi:hypothetical protein
VNSGNGIHAYWLLEETLTRAEWEPLAKRLKQLCKEHGLIVDDKVFEASRVLRPLNSFNFKTTANPKAVETWNEKLSKDTRRADAWDFGSNCTLNSRRQA